MRLTDDDKRSFLDEARTIARLKHPNIVRIMEYDVADNIPFLIMEYAPNGTLRQRHPKGSVLSPATIVPYVKQVAAALQYAHDQKLIHRDVKPENMLLGYRDTVLLSDFGLAIIVQSSRDRLQTVAGTVTYMAPEQLQGKVCPAAKPVRQTGGTPSLGTHHATYRDHTAAVMSIAWSPDGKHIASASADKTVHVWNAIGKKRISTYREHSKQVSALAWSPDATRIASGSWDTTVQVWSVAGGRKLFTYRGFSREVSTVAWSPDGKYIASGSWDTTVQIRQATTGGKLFTYQGHR